MNGLLSGYLPSPAMQRSFSPQPFAAPTVDPTLPWKQPGYSQPSQAYTPQQFTPSKADKKAALFKALGAMGPALIAGGAPSLTPGGGSQAIGQAGQLFNNAYDSHLQGVKGDQMQQYQMGRQQNMDRMAGEQHTAQMGQFNQAAQQRQAAQQWASSLSPDHPLYRLAKVNPEAAYKVGLKQAATTDKPNLPTGMRLDASGKWVYDENYLAGQQRLKEAGRNQTEISMGPQETEEQKAYGKQLVERFGGAQESADNARALNAQVGLAMNINDANPDLDDISGFQAAIGDMATFMGFPEASIKSVLGNVTAAQDFTGVMQNLVLAKMQQQKGPQTENDAARIEKTVANLGQGAESRKFLLRAARAVGNRDIQRGRFLADYRAQHKTLDGAFKAWDDLYGSAPLVFNHETQGPVFFEEWLPMAKDLNPNATDEDLIIMWKDISK